jgi:hypothetical protein
MKRCSSGTGGAVMATHDELRGHGQAWGFATPMAWSCAKPVAQKDYSSTTICTFWMALWPDFRNGRGIG